MIVALSKCTKQKRDGTRYCSVSDDLFSSFVEMDYLHVAAVHEGWVDWVWRCGRCGDGAVVYRGCLHQCVCVCLCVLVCLRA